MAQGQSGHGRRLVRGSASLFLAGILFPVTGIVTAAYLARTLGPADYGVLTIAVTLVLWVEWAIGAFLTRVTVKLVSEADDWRPVGTTVLRLHGLVGGAACVVLLLSAVPLARVMDLPALVLPLCLMALDIPVATMGQAHLNLLAGLGRYHSRAVAHGLRWVVRLLLVIALVEAGLSVEGAVLGMIGASVAELLIARGFVRPGLGGDGVAVRPLLVLGLPILLSALSVHCYTNLGLLMLKALGGTAEEAGYFAAANNLAILPGILASAVSASLLSTMNGLAAAGRVEEARAIGRDAMRVALGLLPFWALGTGAATEVVTLFFGAAFAPAGPLLSVLLLAGVALVVTSVATTVLIVAGAPRLIFLLTAPLVPFALAGYAWAVPAFGALGAAGVNAVFATLGAALASVAGGLRWAVWPPAGTVLRTAAVAAGAYAVAAGWATPGLMVLVKIALVCAGIPLLYALLGEFDRADRAALAAHLRRLEPGTGAPPARAPRG